MPDSQKVRTAINSVLKIRVILITSWIFTIVGLTCAMTVWFSGRLDLNQATVTMVTYNTSELGLSHYHNQSSPLHRPVRALVPPEIVNPLTITEFLGVKDWYSVSYLWTCEGRYRYDTTSNLFTGPIHEPSCEAQQLGGTDFSLRTIVTKQLKESVKALAEEIPEGSYSTANWVWTSCIAWWIALLNFTLMPWTFIRGTQMGKGSWCLIPITFALVAFALFLAVTIDIGRDVPGDQNTTESKYIGRVSSRFIAFNVVSIVFMFLSFNMGVLGWGVGIWLEDSMPLSDAENTTANSPLNIPPRSEHIAPAALDARSNFPRATEGARAAHDDEINSPSPTGDMRSAD